MPFPLIAVLVVVARVALVAAPRVIPVVVRAAAPAAARAIPAAVVVAKAAPRVIVRVAKRGNTRLNRYRDKAMEKLSKFCRKAVDKFGAHIHGRKKDVIKPGSGKESNHVLQNAFFEESRGAGSSLCPGYKTSRAPAIPADKAPHATITKMQRDSAARHRANGTQPTYDDARREARTQTRVAGANRKEAECIMKFVDQVMEQLCPDLIKANRSNPVKLRGPGAPKGGGGGGAIN
jgi:hypothetical protein